MHYLYHLSNIQEDLRCLSGFFKNLWSWKRMAFKNGVFYKEWRSCFPNFGCEWCWFERNWGPRVGRRWKRLCCYPNNRTESVLGQNMERDRRRRHSVACIRQSDPNNVGIAPNSPSVNAILVYDKDVFDITFTLNQFVSCHILQLIFYA